MTPTFDKMLIVYFYFQWQNFNVQSLCIIDCSHFTIGVTIECAVFARVYCTIAVHIIKRKNSAQNTLITDIK